MCDTNAKYYYEKYKHVEKNEDCLKKYDLLRQPIGYFSLGIFTLSKRLIVNAGEAVKFPITFQPSNIVTKISDSDDLFVLTKAGNYILAVVIGVESFGAGQLVVSMNEGFGFEELSYTKVSRLGAQSIIRMDTKIIANNPNTIIKIINPVSALSTLNIIPFRGENKCLSAQIAIYKEIVPQGGNSFEIYVKQNSIFKKSSFIFFPIIDPSTNETFVKSVPEGSDQGHYDIIKGSYTLELRNAPEIPLRLGILINNQLVGEFNSTGLIFPFVTTSEKSTVKFAYNEEDKYIQTSWIMFDKLK